MSLNSMDNYLEMTYKKQISEIRSKKKIFNKGSNFKTKTMVRTQKSWNDSQNTRRIYTDGIKPSKESKLQIPQEILKPTAVVCVCLYSFTLKTPSVCKDVRDILEGTNQRSCVASIILGASAKFLHLRF